MSRIVTLGEIMGRLAAPGHRRFQQAMPGTLEVTFAGAEASVAVGIARLGGDAAFVSALPAHDLGDACLASLRAHAVDTRFIVRTPGGRLGLYFVEAGVNQRPGQVIYDRDHSAFALTPPGAYDWPAIFAGAEWFVLSGITPALTATTAEVARTAVQEADRHGVNVALDLNYRSKLWNWDPPRPPRMLAAATLRGLMPWVDLLIGGPADAGLLLDNPPPTEPEDPAAAESLAQRLAEAYPRTRRIALTQRAGQSASTTECGALLADFIRGGCHHAPARGRRHFIPQIVDRLGAGDAFTAGLLFALTTPDLADPASAIAFAAAAGCLAHSIEGDFNLSSRSEIEALMHEEPASRIRR
jgi:2-dehydro-3-deoxygluconokinase